MATFEWSGGGGSSSGFFDAGAIQEGFGCLDNLLSESYWRCLVFFLLVLDVTGFFSGRLFGFHTLGALSMLLIQFLQSEEMRMWLQFVVNVSLSPFRKHSLSSCIFPSQSRVNAAYRRVQNLLRETLGDHNFILRSLTLSAKFEPTASTGYFFGVSCTLRRCKSGLSDSVFSTTSTSPSQVTGIWARSDCPISSHISVCRGGGGDFPT